MKFNLGKILKGLILSFLVLGGWVFALNSCSNASHLMFTDNSKTLPKIFVNEKNLEDFSSIEISSNEENVNLIPSDSYGLEICTCEKVSTPTWSLKNNKLTIETIHKFNLFSFSFPGEPMYINVYYPKSDFKSVLIKSVSGNININFNTCENATFSSTSGDITVKGNTLENTEAKSTSGDVELSGDLKGDSKFSSTSGDVKINCNNAVSNYIYNLNSLSGKITVDGKKFKKSAKNSVVNISNPITVETTSGNIDLEFKD